MTDHRLARRTLLTSAGLGLGAGFLSGSASVHAEAAAAEPAAGAIWSSEYWAHKGEVNPTVWPRPTGAPNPGEPPLPILFLVHGSSLSGRSSYDLDVPGKD